MARLPCQHLHLHPLLRLHLCAQQKLSEGAMVGAPMEVSKAGPALYIGI
jgi:hypothetical protein